MKVLNYHWLYPQITESAIYVGECFLTGASLPHSRLCATVEGLRSLGVLEVGLSFLV